MTTAARFTEVSWQATDKGYNVVKDPGDAGSINAGTSSIRSQISRCELVSAAAETRTLAAPQIEGLFLTISCKTYVGNITMTVTGGYDQAGTTSIVFNTAGDSILLESIDVSGTIRWQLRHHEGVTGPVVEMASGSMDTLTVDTALTSTGTTALTGEVSVAAGIVIGTGARIITDMPTPETATATATLTDAQMLTGVLVATPTGAAAYTMRTGTQLDAALLAAGITMAVDSAFDLTIINLGGTGDDITLTASTGISIVGDPVVGPIADVATEQGGQGTFRLRRTAANTFVAYRVS